MRTHAKPIPHAMMCSALFYFFSLLSIPTQADWLLEPEINSGSLKLSDNFEFSPGEPHENSLAAYSIGAQVGYEFKNFIFIKAGLTDGETENLLGLLDRIDFYDKHLSTGVQWPVSKRVSLLGAVGMSNWTYTVKDQSFFQANQKDKRQTGNALEYRAGINFRFNRLLSMDIYGGKKNWDDKIQYVQYGASLCLRFE